jgi:hypothetical protein
MLRAMFARLILLLLVAVPTIALGADDPQPDAPIFVPPPPKPAAVADTAPKPAPQPAIQSRVTPPPIDPEACRMTCAQANYFCSANDSGGDMCGQTWSQCVSNCNSPGLDPAAAPAQ